MSVIERSFKINEQYFELLHIFEDDSRDVVNSDGDVLLKFTNDLHILNNLGERVARMGTKRDLWVLQREGHDEVELGAHNNYHWVALADCEVRAAKHLLS